MYVVFLINIKFVYRALMDTIGMVKNNSGYLKIALTAKIVNYL